MNESSTVQPPRTGIKPIRRYDIDWLRVFAMGMVFIFHNGMPYGIWRWNVNNFDWSKGFAYWNFFLVVWIMPLFFVISGMASYFALATRNPGQYALTRFKRLIIPFIFALFAILPLHVYSSRVAHGYSGSFFDPYFWKLYFTWWFPFDFEVSRWYFRGSNQGIYLWYLFWLFIFSVGTVHFFKYLRNAEMTPKIVKLAGLCNRPGGIFILAIPLIIVDLVARPPYFVVLSPYGAGKLPAYLMFFILGYVVVSDSRFEQTIAKNRLLALVLSILTSILLLVCFNRPIDLQQSTPFSMLWAFNGWCWTITILSFGPKFLNFNHKYLGAITELILPFYLLHEAIIVATAVYVIRLDLLIIGKFFLQAVTSFGIISLLLVPIRQINPLRFLFGMRAKMSIST